MIFKLKCNDLIKSIDIFSAAGCLQMVPGMNLKKEVALLFGEDENNCTLYQNESLSEGLFWNIILIVEFYIHKSM